MKRRLKVLRPGPLGLLPARPPRRRGCRQRRSGRLRAPPPRSRRFHGRRRRPGFLPRLRTLPPDRRFPRPPSRPDHPPTTPHPRRPPSSHLPRRRSHPRSRRVHLSLPRARRSRLRPPLRLIVPRRLPPPRRPARPRAPRHPRDPLPPGRVKTSYTRDQTGRGRKQRTARTSGHQQGRCSRVLPEMLPERRFRPLASDDARKHGHTFPKTTN
jgi:hypothetical protein